MDQAKALLEIQRCDLEIGRLEKQLAEMPEKRAILAARKRIQDIESLGTRTQAFVQEIERVVSKDEDEVSAISAKMESEQAKLLSGKITSPKEVQHISNELDMFRRQKEKTENEILAQMEKRELALAQYAKVEAAMADAVAKEAALVEGFKGKGGTLQQDIEDRVHRRKEALASLSPENKALYESAKAARSGVVIGVLKESMCGACRMELPAETVAELKSGDPIAVCPLCKRILVVTHESEEEVDI